MNQKEQIDIYIENGYEDRNDYLNSLADEYGILEETVVSIANLLGPEEDFDGLLTSLADYQGEYDDE